MNEIKASSITETNDALRATFEVFRNNKPLTVGIKVEMEGYSPKEIQQAVSRYVSTTTYLRNVKYGTHRFNLDGTQAEEIQPEHKEMARLRLNERAVKRAWYTKDLSGLTPSKILKKQTRYAKRLGNIQHRIKVAASAFNKAKV